MAGRLQRLFDLYSQDLERLAPALRGRFGCPICFAAFPRSEPLREVVAEEHVVPETLGGKFTTLTCRRCNNQAGTSLEAHLVQRVLVEARRRPAKASVQIGDAVVRAEMVLPRVGDELRTIKVIGKQTDARQLASMQRLLMAGTDEVHLHLNFGYVEQRSLVALLRAAYLLMFRTFGYRYVLDPSAIAVREQIRHWSQQSPILKGVVWRLEGAPFQRSTAMVMTRPTELASFVVLLQLDTDEGHVAAVTLPAPGSDGVELYDRIGALGKASTVIATPLPETKGFLPFVRVWRAITDPEAT